MGHYGVKPERNIFTDVILKWICDIIVVVLVATFLILFLGEKAEVIGNSMADEISSGQGILIDKMSYELRDIERFDVVVYRSNLSGEEEYVMKRVIGLPGEEIQILDAKIYVNGKELKDIYYDGSYESGYAKEKIKIEKDCYFVLGDNRNLSQDSRFEYVGNIRREQIVGRAWLVLSPFSQIKMIK